IRSTYYGELSSCLLDHIKLNESDLSPSFSSCNWKFKKDLAAKTKKGRREGMEGTKKYVILVFKKIMITIYEA
ncbi:hypothetical protein IGI04_038013, partial [Brassica rapa subsp. trilocularis]